MTPTPAGFIIGFNLIAMGVLAMRAFSTLPHAAPPSDKLSSTSRSFCHGGFVRKWSLLSITDIHYESPDSNFEDDPKETEIAAYRTSSLEAFHQLIENGFRGKQFDLISLAGDFTTHGKSPGFDRFVKDAFPKLTRLVADSRAIAAVPGNHDVTWGLSPFKPASFDKKFQNMWRLVDGRKVTSCLYPKGSLTLKHQDQLSFNRPKYGPTYFDRNHKILALCINSAIRCGELNTKIFKAYEESLKNTIPAGTKNRTKVLSDLKKSFQKHAIRDVAHVTHQQRIELKNALEDLDDDVKAEWIDYLKVAILHHPLLPFPKQTVEHRGYEALLDASDVLSFLIAAGFDLVLSGHKHQDFCLPYSNDERQMLLVGGPTIGGYQSGGAPRGFHMIDVEDHGNGERHFKVTLLSLDSAELKPLKVEQIRLLPLSPEQVWKQRQRGATYSYRELACMTLINEDGDARKIVQCEDLWTAPGSKRAGSHEISLPPTSGLLSTLSARSRDGDFVIEIQNESSEDGRQLNPKATLRFSQPIGADGHGSYTYEWWSVDAFALDDIQFAYKYGHNAALQGKEFTHFTTSDPVHDFTLIVQFPPQRTPPDPHIRVATADPSQADARRWEIDIQAESELKAGHALRFLKEMNIASLRVPNPRPGLSYGIQWTVPQIVAPTNDPFAEDLRSRLQKGLTREDLWIVLVGLTDLFDATREMFLQDWNGPLDISLMYFDGESKLPLLAAAKQDRHHAELRELKYQAAFRYGQGIAGRAFKGNGLRVWSGPSKRNSAKEPQYYIALPGSPVHRVLVCWPVHTPVADSVHKNNPQIYDNMPPYAVFSVGSELADCPLSRLKRPELQERVSRCQHQANKIIHHALHEVLKRHPSGVQAAPTAIDPRLDFP